MFSPFTEKTFDSLLA